LSFFLQRRSHKENLFTGAYSHDLPLLHRSPALFTVLTETLPEIKNPPEYLPSPPPLFPSCTTGSFFFPVLSPDHGELHQAVFPSTPRKAVSGSDLVFFPHLGHGGHVSASAFTHKYFFASFFSSVFRSISKDLVIIPFRVHEKSA